MQGLDAKLDQLAHRRRNLAELAEISRTSSALADVADLLVAAQTEESDVRREVAKAESDVEAVRSRSVRDRQRMDSGAVGSAKELEALQHEVESLARRQSDLEDIELEAMERLESIQARVAELAERKATLTGELGVLQTRCDEEFVWFIDARPQLTCELGTTDASVSVWATSSRWHRLRRQSHENRRPKGGPR